MAGAAALETRVVRSAAPTWAVSFADLGLLLLGCFVMLHAMETDRPSAAAAPVAPAAPVPRLDTLRASDLFETGEARLRPGMNDRLREIAGRLPDGAIQVVSRGTAEGGSRLDRFELAAARAAAVARALREAGVPDHRLTVRLEPSAAAADTQSLEIVRR